MDPRRAVSIATFGFGTIVGFLSIIYGYLHDNATYILVGYIVALLATLEFAFYSAIVKIATELKDMNRRLKRLEDAIKER